MSSNFKSVEETLLLSCLDLLNGRHGWRGHLWGQTSIGKMSSAKVPRHAEA